VSICDINEDVGVKLADLLSAKFGKEKVIFCPCDVTDYPQFQGIAAKCHNNKMPWRQIHENCTVAVFL